MDAYATMYLIVKDSHLYNQWGIKDNKSKGKSSMVEDVEAPPMVDPNLLWQVNSILLQQMQVDGATLGLDYFDNDTKPTLILEAWNTNSTTYTEKKVMYVFLKTNIILDLEVIYKDRYNIEYTRVPKEVVQTYHFQGLPLYNAIGLLW